MEQKFDWFALSGSVAQAGSQKRPMLEWRVSRRRPASGRRDLYFTVVSKLVGGEGA